MRQEVVHEAAKASPPLAVTTWAWLHGLTISDAVGLATLAYIALQSLYLLWKWNRERKKK